MFYVFSYYQVKVNNGGLCQFFVNSGRAVAPFLLDCLAELGADAHKALLDDFVGTHGIDLADLSSFEVTNTRAYRKQTQRYPFDSFDNAFYELPLLDPLLVTYIKAHISEF